MALNRLPRTVRQRVGGSGQAEPTARFRRALNTAEIDRRLVDISQSEPDEARKAQKLQSGLALCGPAILAWPSALALLRKGLNLAVGFALTDLARLVGAVRPTNRTLVCSRRSISASRAWMILLVSILSPGLYSPRGRVASCGLEKQSQNTRCVHCEFNRAIKLVLAFSLPLVGT
jgi:hypothetical protein